MAFPSFSVSY